MTDVIENGTSEESNVMTRGSTQVGVAETRFELLEFDRAFPCTHTFITEILIIALYQ